MPTALLRMIGQQADALDRMAGLALARPAALLAAAGRVVLTGTGTSQHRGRASQIQPGHPVQRVGLLADHAQQRGRHGPPQHSMTFTARPPREVSL